MKAPVHAFCIALALGAAAGAVELPKNVTTADVCAVVPGTLVAQALGAKLIEAKLVRPDGAHARCVYTVTPPGVRSAKAVFILWLHASGDFDDLRAYQDDPVGPVEALGDAAFVSYHRDSERHDLFVLVRGVAAVEVTGPDAATVRTVASVAIGRLGPSR